MKQKTLFDDVKASRVGIDREIQRVNAWLLYSDYRGAGGPELTIAKRKLQEARHWLGEVLKEIGSPLPEEYRDVYKEE